MCISMEQDVEKEEYPSSWGKNSINSGSLSLFSLLH